MSGSASGAGDDTGGDRRDAPTAYDLICPASGAQPASSTAHGQVIHARQDEAMDDLLAIWEASKPIKNDWA